MDAPHMRRILLPCEGSCGAGEGAACHFACTATSRRFREEVVTGDHDRAFFEQMATCREPYRRLGDAIASVLPPSRALDLGAGLGAATARLRELGWEAFASELHAPWDLREPVPAMWFPGVDLTSRIIAGTWYTVICTETAEHIPAEHADTVVLNVAERAGRLIVWSAAQPGQEWPGHVNLRTPAYWLGRFGRHGFDADMLLTLRLRDEMRARHAQHHHAADNFFVLGRVR